MDGLGGVWAWPNLCNVMAPGVSCRISSMAIWQWSVSTGRTRSVPEWKHWMRLSGGGGRGRGRGRGVLVFVFVVGGGRADDVVVRG